MISFVILGCSEPPVDNDLRARFINNKDVFNKLVQMIKEDEKVRWIHSGSVEPTIEPTNSLDENRILSELQAIYKNFGFSPLQ